MSDTSLTFSNTDRTWEQCRNDDPETIYAFWQEGEFQCVILRGPNSVNGYIGVLPNHPLYGLDYMDRRVSGIECHGGLTYAGMGHDGHALCEPFWWFGWDYAHLWDRVFYEDHPGDMEWTPRYILAEFPGVIKSFRRSSGNYTLIDVEARDGE